MLRRRLRFLFLFILMVPFISGCVGNIHEIITCDPIGADIYWGKTQSNLENSGYKTPYSTSCSGSRWESWCYQVKKEGYHDSEIICTTPENYRHMDFSLKPIQTIVSSDPPGATIYWGPSIDQLKETIYKTPRTEHNVQVGASGANWKDWYYQVKKKGYHDSEIVFKHKSSNDRYVHFELKPED